MPDLNHKKNQCTWPSNFKGEKKKKNKKSSAKLIGFECYLVYPVTFDN